MNNMDSKHEISLYQPDNKGEIILYQPDDTIRLEVRIEDETVWLTQAQMAELFQTTKQNVSLHINNAFKEGELDKISVVKHSLTTAADGKNYRTKSYNLDVIISAGYRVKSIRGTAFRKWATKTLKDYLLKGFVVNQRIERLESKIMEHDQKFDLLLKISQQQNDLFQNEIRQIKFYIESILADFNDINEDTRMQLEMICQLLAEIQNKNKLADKPRKKIGFHAEK